MDSLNTSRVFRHVHCQLVYCWVGLKIEVQSTIQYLSPFREHSAHNSIPSTQYLLLHYTQQATDTGHERFILIYIMIKVSKYVHPKRWRKDATLCWDLERHQAVGSVEGKYNFRCVEARQHDHQGWTRLDISLPAVTQVQHSSHSEYFHRIPLQYLEMTSIHLTVILKNNSPSHLGTAIRLFGQKLSDFF